MGADAAPIQVEQLVCFRQLAFLTGWPTCAEKPGALPCKFLNLSGCRFGTHMDALGAWKTVFGRAKHFFIE